MRLLNRTTLNYVVYSVVVLLLVTPLFYWVIEGLFIKDVDETLLIQKKEIQFRVRNHTSDSDLSIWAAIDGKAEIEMATDASTKDSLYSIVQYDSIADEFEPYRVLASTLVMNGRPYRLTTKISLVESEDLISAVVITQSVVLVLLLAGLMIINWSVSKRIWKPFYDTLEKLSQFEVEKTPTLKLGTSVIKEFKDLNRSIELLADRNYKTYLNQKEFTENAAHEMQTPLAVFQLKLELLMQTKELTEEQAELISSLMDSVGRFSKLNKTLLLLSKIENHQFVETEKINIRALTSKLISIYEHLAHSKNIKIEFSGEDLEVEFNPVLIDILLSNLISNALVHSAPDGEITIGIEGKKWQAKNAGEAALAAPDKIYERFYKGTAHPSSTGLGLAIVKKIADRSPINIHYEFNAGHHIFSIGF
jgi:signal transduction histidine kinase